MKRIIGAFLLSAMTLLMITGCALTMPAPEIKEGKFDVSVTYEINGEEKTLDLVYVCAYDGVDWTMEGVSYRAWNGHFEGYGDGDVIEISQTEDGAKIALCILIYPEYFMGEPDFGHFAPFTLINVISYEDGVEMIEDDQELIAEEYGVRAIDIKFDEPIQNSFKSFI